jgi:ribosomal protein S18 acetylase RimI-like enzyme
LVTSPDNKISIELTIGHQDGGSGQGIGSKLIVQAVQQMNEMGITYIYALTKVDNQRIQSVLTHNGFHERETMKWFESRPI